MNATFEQLTFIVKNNPNKATIAKGKEMADKLMLHIHGVGMESAIKFCDYFANPDLFKVQKQYAISNIDLFYRILQQEDMVFSARGGSTYFSLPDSQESEMNAILDDVRYKMSLRKWIRNFALQAYRSDPMGIIFIEIEKLFINAEGIMNEPKAYPTYKSIYSIFDYSSTGRQLEYVCFRLTVAEALAFGIIDDKLKDTPGSSVSDYYRFVDDAKDVIVKYSENVVSLATNISQQNPLENAWKKTPAVIVSDLIKFNDTSVFVSPVQMVIELAEDFLEDRSVRNLQKKYHGFAKAVEPLLSCSKCAGTGYTDGNACPDCSIPGADKGTGYKMKTKVSDVARFPLSVFEDGAGFDFKKIYGYATPDIASWDKQDTSLVSLEDLIHKCYWGTSSASQTNGPRGTELGSPSGTATEVLANLQPVYARLNMTADWAETTEKMIADFIGKFWFENFKKSAISYGRDYILETPDLLMEIYTAMRTAGAPTFSLDEALQKFYQAKYQNNPVQLVKYLKMLDVEPFPHINMAVAITVITNFEDYNAKLYFGEWANTIADIIWATVEAPKLSLLLKAYVAAKGIIDPATVAPLKAAEPSFN